MRIRDLLPALLLAVLGCGGGGSVTPPQASPGYTLAIGTPAAIQPGQSGSAAATLVRAGGYQAAVTLSLAGNAQGITGNGTIAAGASARGAKASQRRPTRDAP